MGDITNHRNEQYENTENMESEREYTVEKYE